MAGIMPQLGMVRRRRSRPRKCPSVWGVARTGARLNAVPPVPLLPCRCDSRVAFAVLCVVRGR